MIEKQISFPVILGVSHFKLLGSQFQVKINYLGRLQLHFQTKGRNSFSDTVNNLYSQQRLALVGVGKEDAQLLLIPEGAKNHFGNWFSLRLFNPLIGGFDDQKIFFGELFDCICLWISGRHSGSESRWQVDEGMV